MLAAVAVVLAPLMATGSLHGDEQFMAVVAPAALVFPLLGVDRLLPGAVAVLAVSVLIAAEHGDLGTVALAVCAGLVLLVGECISAAGNLAPLVRVERGLARRLVLRLAVEAAAAVVLAAAVLASARLGVSSGLAPLVLGLLATVSLIVPVAWLLGGRVRWSGDGNVGPPRPPSGDGPGV